LAKQKLITIYTTGTRGDVAPFLPLAHGLQRAGFDVRLTAGSNFRSLIEAAGIAFAPVELDYDALLLAPEIQSMMERGGTNLLGAMLRLFPRAMGMISGAMRDAWRAAPGTDAVLFTANGPWGWHIARALKVPAVYVTFQPAAPSGEVPCSVALSEPSLPIVNRLSHWAFMLVTWLPLRGRFNRWRKEELGLPPLGLAPPFPAPDQRLMAAYSPTLSPRPRDWPPLWRTAGHWLADPPPDWQPPADLAAFLDSGPPPLYLGFGSVVIRDKARITEVVRGALEITGRRAVVSRGWNLLKEEEMPQQVHLLNPVPHAWLFPRCSLIVHHGGGGTTGAGARSGVPSMAVPYGADQPFWGRRLHALGVGPAPIPYGKVTAEKLAAAIREAEDDPVLREAAAEVGRKIRGEDGVDRAVQIVREAVAEAISD